MSRLINGVKYLLEDNAYCIAYRWVKPSDNLWNNNRGEFIVDKPSRKYWYADPVLFRHEGRTYILAEQFNRRIEKGNIAVSEIVRGKKLKWKTVICEEYHMSFPNVFEFNGDLFMTPECSSTEAIIIYKMASPFKWEKYCVININARIVDIIAKVDDGGVILLGGTYRESNPIYTKRTSYFLKNLENPEKIECKLLYADSCESLLTRNAGLIFSMEGEEYNVTQESLEDFYGKNIILNKVSSFDRTAFEVTALKKAGTDKLILPSKWKEIPSGMHSYGYINEELEVVDFNGQVIGSSLRSIKNKAIIYAKSLMKRL